MNTKYKVDKENNVTVLDGEKEIQRKEKYTNNTEEILSLENTSTTLENKINRLKENLNELQEKNVDEKKNIIILLSLFICSLIIALLSTEILFIIKIISVLGIFFSITSTIIKTKKIFINKKEIKKQEKRITEEINRKTRVNKRIETLSKSKKITSPKKTNEYLEIKPIYNFNFTPTDYFVENYQIVKRTEEMTKGKKKIKKELKHITTKNIKYNLHY